MLMNSLSVLCAVSFAAMTYGSATMAAPRQCDHHFELAQSAAGALIKGREDVRFTPDKPSLLRLAETLAQYPGESEWKTVIFNKVMQGKDRARLDLSDIYSVPDCHTVGYFKLAKACIDSVLRYPLNREERAQVKEGVMQFIARDLEGPTGLVALAVRVSLVRRLSENFLIEDKKLKDFHFEEIEKRISVLKDDLRVRNQPWEKVTSPAQYRALPSAERAKFNEAIAFETIEVDKIRGDFQALLARL
jgi:hypothetical protein